MITVKKRSPIDVTNGSIWRALYSLSMPIIFANILQTAYQLTDTFWVGRLGKEAVAAVSLSFPVIFLMISLGGGLAIAGTILVSQYKGKKDQDQVNYVSAQTLLMMIYSSIIVSIIGFVLSRPIMNIMGAEPNVFVDAVQYLQISFVGLPFVFGYFVFQSLMRGVGDVRTPMYIVFGTVVLNLLLDPLFILGFGPIPSFGVSGAALATIGTQGIAALIGLSLLFNGKYGIHLQKGHFAFDKKLLKQMFMLGLPSSVDQSTRALGLTIMSFLVASFGTITVAAYGIGIRILSFIIIPAMGLSMATATLVGQNIGAEQRDRAQDIATKSAIISFVFLSLIGVITYIFALPIVSAFLPGEPQAIAAAVQFIHIMAFTFGFIGLQQTIAGAFTGSGNTMTTMSISIISLWIIQFPVAYFLSKHTGLGSQGLWLAFPIANILSAIIGIVIFAKGSWKHKQVTPQVATKTEVFTETKVEEGVTS